jgi:hypothetical protein
MDGGINIQAFYDLQKTSRTISAEMYYSWQGDADRDEH